MADEPAVTPKPAAPAKPKKRKAKKKPKPKAPPAKADKGAPQVCKRCAKKWAQYDKDGLCAKCAKEAEDELFPPPRSEDIPADDDKPVPTAQELKRARIFEISRLMAAGEWRPHMARKLGELWGLTKKTAQHYSAEAARLLDYTTKQRATLVTIAKLRLLEVLQQDESDRVQAARTLLEHMGELRQNVTVKAPDPFEGWTDDEIKAYGTTGEKPERFRGGRKG